METLVCLTRQIPTSPDDGAKQMEDTTRLKASLNESSRPSFIAPGDMERVAALFLATGLNVFPYAMRAKVIHYANQIVERYVACGIAQVSYDGVGQRWNSNGRFIQPAPSSICWNPLPLGVNCDGPNCCQEYLRAKDWHVGE